MVTTAAEAKSAGAIFESAKIPLICLWDSSPELEAIGDYVFGIGTWLPFTGETAADFAFHHLGSRRAAVLDNEDEWSMAVGKVFSQRFKGMGGEIVFHETLPPAVSDVKTYVAKLISLSPDVLYAPIGFNTAAVFRQFKQFGFNKPIIESDNLNPEIIRAADGALEHAYQTQSADPRNARARYLAEKYEQRFGHKPDHLLYTAWGYDAVMLLAQTARKWGTTSDAIKSGLYKVNGYDGASGTISIGAEGSSRSPVSVFQVENGTLVKVP